MGDLSKKNSTMLILLAVIVAVVVTFGLLNSPQTTKTVDSSGSPSSGEVSLTLEKPPKVKDEGSGELTLEVVDGGQK
ncbi:hypothetical protein ISS07_01495 [Candidatus Woesearchaeota archaeon]|nr:hypothetical protein [Candidatus Woesearchaeota archaeon]